MQTLVLNIRSLDMQGRGVGHLDGNGQEAGKVIFVEGALPGETVRFESYQRKTRWEAAKATEFYSLSPYRSIPRCDVFGICGGCVLQHQDPATQVSVKQRLLEGDLWHIGRVKADSINRPIHGPYWHYRYRARFSVKYVKSKEKVLVGFHERKSSFITDMHSCDVLPVRVSRLLSPLRQLVSSLSMKGSVPQIELAVTDVDDGRVILVLRALQPPTQDDLHLLRKFSEVQHVEWWIQEGKEEDSYPLDDGANLRYVLPEYGVFFPFRPTDFIQINQQVNPVLVSKAVRALDIKSEDNVVDLFCGIGNFTLPIAKFANNVLGIEGSKTLVDRANNNAEENNLAGKVHFKLGNLFDAKAGQSIDFADYNKLLMDPPRDGAHEICKYLAALSKSGPAKLPEKIVYVSCNPATLARDAGLLVNEAGYRLTQAGVINMFPHTAHVESLTVFDRT